MNDDNLGLTLIVALEPIWYHAHKVENNFYITFPRNAMAFTGSYKNEMTAPWNVRLLALICGWSSVEVRKILDTSNESNS